MMRKITCRCDAQFEADLPLEIDLDQSEATLREILTGSFFALTCPTCGELLKPELTVRLRSRKRGIDLYVIPEKERLAFYRGQVETPKEAQLIIGYDELVERVRCIEQELDPVAVELLKYWLTLKAEEKNPEASVLIRFAGSEQGKLRFDVEGIKEGEIGVLHLGRDIYERSLAEKAKTLQEQPFARIFAGQYASIRLLENEPDED